MATCKDCIHYRTCADQRGVTRYYGEKVATNSVECLCDLFSPDLVRVVRCKDCKHAYTLVTCALRLCGGVDDETFYCASGERKE